MTPMTIHRASHMLDKAQWAGSIYSGFARDDVLRIADGGAQQRVAQSEGRLMHHQEQEQ